MHLKIMAALLFLVSFAFVPACGADRDCVELCDEGQSGNCTAIDGSCSSFCSALDNVQDKAGCADQRESYESCLNGEDNVCDTSCGAEESSLTNCVVAFCAGDPSNGDCQTLANAFL